MNDSSLTSLLPWPLANGSFEAGSSHQRVKFFQSLKTNRIPNPQRLITLEGIFQWQQAQRMGKSLSHVLIAPSLLKTPEQRAALAQIQQDESIALISEKTALKLSERSKCDGLFALTEIDIRPLEEAKGKYFALIDGLEIPGNAGTLIRSADGAGLSGLIFCNRKFRWTHPKVLEASLGTCFTVPLYECSTEEAMDWIEKENFLAVLADGQKEKSDSLIEVYQSVKDTHKDCVLLLGSEKYGFDKIFRKLENQYSVKLAMRGQADSLNVANAASILFYLLGELYAS